MADTIQHTLGFGCRRIDLEAYPAAWGARAILYPGAVDIVPDRVDSFGSEADKVRLFAHLDEHLPRSVLSEKAGWIPGNDDSLHVIYEDAAIKVVASAQKSYGYLYITAVLKESV